jgi:hypothetical protein
MKLSKGMKVTVVGIKGQWLKIEPPEGSFAYVPKSFVIMRNDGTVGRMNREWLAKAGSELNDLAAQPLATVHDGEDVQIIGQHNEYFKIKPPKESYLWINKQFVDPLKTVAPPVEAVVEKPAPATDDKATKTEPDTTTTIASQTSTTRPAEAIADNTLDKPATTQPSFDAIAEYQKLEDAFVAASAKQIADQPLPELLSGYQHVIASDQLPSSMRSIAEIRVETLKVRNDAREKFIAVTDNTKKMTEQRQALVAERQEIEDRIKQNDVQIYAAIGTLRPSSLQIGQVMLYRLTDPATGRTVAYVRTNDVKYAQYLGQFIGVRGNITNDPQLKSVIENPVDSQPIDPSKVNQSVAAQIIPPSLLKFGAAPSTQPAANPSASAINPARSTVEPQ